MKIKAIYVRTIACIKTYTWHQTPSRREPRDFKEYENTKHSQIQKENVKVTSYMSIFLW